MEFQQKIVYQSQFIHVMGVHSHVNFILIKRQNVGIVDAWVNVLHLVNHHAQPHAMEDALIMNNRVEIHLKLEKEKDALLDVQLIVLDHVLVHVKDIV